MKPRIWVEYVEDYADDVDFADSDLDQIYPIEPPSSPEPQPVTLTIRVTQRDGLPYQEALITLDEGESYYNSRILGDGVTLYVGRTN